MKILVATAMLVAGFSASASAQTGNIGGADAAGAPRNSSIIMSQRPRGMDAHGYVVVKKRKRPHTVVVREPVRRGY